MTDAVGMVPNPVAASSIAASFNVEIKNRFVLVSVYFIVAVVHRVKLPSSSANVGLTSAKSFV